MIDERTITFYWGRTTEEYVEHLFFEVEEPVGGAELRTLCGLGGAHVSHSDLRGRSLCLECNVQALTILNISNRFDLVEKNTTIEVAESDDGQ